MSRSLFSLLLLAARAPGQPDPPEGVRAGDVTPRELSGRWVATRDVPRDGTPVRSRLLLDFTRDRLTMTTEVGGKKETEFVLTVVEARPGTGLPRLVLGHGERSRYEVAYDAEGDRLVLVGRLLNRPFEGFSLSGVYRRPAAAR
jgi:hypothetical protein